MLYLIPFISALIGWFTNYVAVKMLFHPKKPINFLGIKIQGVFPKRQQQFAEKVGALVGDQLFSIADIKDKIVDPSSTDGIMEVVDVKIDEFLRTKLIEAMPMLAMVMGDDLRNKIKSTLMAEFEAMLPEVIDKFVDDLESKVDIKEIVQERVANFSFEKLEEVMYSIMSKEFRFIEIIGAILGFLIGCAQIGLLQFA